MGGEDGYLSIDVRAQRGGDPGQSEIHHSSSSPPTNFRERAKKRGERKRTSEVKGKIFLPLEAGGVKGGGQTVEKKRMERKGEGFAIIWGEMEGGFRRS